MENCSLSDGFRVLLKVMRDDGIKMKCFIFINLYKMKFIKDVENHVKTVLEVEDISLFVNDAWLPSNETVHLIKEDDIVVVKPFNKTIVESDTVIEDVNVPRKRKKKHHQEDPPDTLLNLVYQELNDKKEELERKVHIPDGTGDRPTTKQEELFDDTLFAVPPPVKRKRIRKHKKKSAKVNNDAIHTNEATSLPNVIFEMNVSPGGKHTRFSEGPESTAAHLLEQTNVESSEITNNTEVGLNENRSNIEIKSEAVCISPFVQEISINEENKDKAISEDLKEVNNCFKQPDLKLKEKNGNSEGTEDILPTTLNSSTIAEKQENPKDDDWKTKLLGLATVKDLESKVFHKKISIQNST